MTREEAILLIKSAQLMLVNPTTNEPVSDLYEALDMAIDALEEKKKSDAIQKCFVDGFCAKRTFKKLGKLIAEERKNHEPK